MFTNITKMAVEIETIKVDPLCTVLLYYVFWLEKREEKVLLSRKGALIDHDFREVPWQLLLLGTQ